MAETNFFPLFTRYLSYRFIVLSAEERSDRS